MPKTPEERNSSFVKLMFNDFSKKMKIPPKFVLLHRGTFTEKCILRPTHTQNQWCVRTKQIENHLYFEKGWKAFAKHHSLEYGDFLLFQYNPQVSEFDVVMFDKSSCSKDPVVTYHQVEEGTPSLSPTKAGQAKYMDPEIAAEELKSSSEFPSFIKVMQKAYVRVGSYLQVPSKFVEPYMQEWATKVKLQVSNKSWFVKSIRNEYHAIWFTSGWRNFVKENSLELGDVCVFQLIDNKHIDTFKVSIFRKSTYSACAKF